MYTGIVKWFDDKKGFGFITGEDSDADIFVHYSAIVSDGYKTLTEGQKVTYELDENSRGDRGLRAAKVEPVK